MAKKANGCSLLDAGVDWSTCTFPDGLRARFAHSKAEQLLSQSQSKGFDVSDSNRLGFVGQRCEGLFYGWRGDLLMVICSGEVAAAHSSFFLGLAGNVSRLDLAVTLRDDEVDRDWAEIALKQCSYDGRVDSGLLTTRIIQGTPNGTTLYIGARSSDRFIRIYDKTAESKGVYPERSWRWEIEYKKPRAGIVAARLLRLGAGPNAVIDVVRAGLADLRVQLPYGNPGSEWVPQVIPRQSNDQTRLAYTTRVVRPFLQKLIDRVGELRVRQALSRSLGDGDDHTSDVENDREP